MSTRFMLFALSLGSSLGLWGCNNRSPEPVRPVETLATPAQPQQSEPEPSPAQPLVWFDEPSHTLGRVDIGDTIEWSFQGINLSEGPIRIGEIRPSCVCSLVRVDPEVVLPGAGFAVRIEIRTAALKPGPLEVQVSATASDLEPEPAQRQAFAVQMFGQLKPARRMWIEPIGTPGRAGARLAQEFSVIAELKPDDPGPSLALTSKESDSDWEVLKTEQSPLDSRRTRWRWRLRVSVPAPETSAPWTAPFSVDCTTPGMSLQADSGLVTGPRRDVAEARPEIFLGGIRPGEPVIIRNEVLGKDLARVLERSQVMFSDARVRIESFGPEALTLRLDPAPDAPLAGLLDFRMSVVVDGVESSWRVRGMWLPAPLDPAPQGSGNQTGGLGP